MDSFLIFAMSMAALPAAPPAPGDVVANISFKDTHYLNRSLDDLHAAKAIVVVFADTGCPLVARYGPTLKQIDADFRDKGVRMVALFSETEEPIAGIAAYGVKHGWSFPCGQDVDGKCATALGATRTPEVIVLDAERKLRYRGRIDDQYRPGGTLPKPTHAELRDALEDVLNGRDVKITFAPADGCPITMPAAKKPDAAINFAEHVAPILQKHCQDCHRPGTVAPFSLIDYHQVTSRAKAIAETVRAGQMPPWYGAPQHSEFVNRRGMSPKEKDTLLTWLASDRPAGDLSKAPPPPPPATDWRIGTPDITIDAPQHDIPESGDVPYHYAILPYVFLHDTWVEAVEIKPESPKVLHHCNIAYAKLGESFSVNNFITGAVPGGEAMTLPPGVCVKIPAGAVIIAQIHYVSIGEAAKCRIRVGLKYARQPVEKQLRLAYVATTRYTIPPGAPAHPVSASRTLPCDAVGIGLFSHMHVRGRDMTFLAHTPDDKTENLLVVPNYNFDWQHAYRWEYGAKKLPQGTRLECVAHYDNSDFNPFNPDPKATVHDGQQTKDEMLNGFVFYVDANEKLGIKVDPKTGRMEK
jgi:Redoxin